MSEKQNVHRLPVRIYYEDTDAGGIVYYANYLKFMERARTEMLREAGISLSKLDEAEGIIFVVGEVNARYKASARLDDELIVETSVKAVGNVSLNLQQNILKRVADTESLLLEGSVSLVLVTKPSKPVRIPANIRDALAPYHPKETI